MFFLLKLKLWVQYMDYVAVMRQFIRAARAGDWNLQLISMEKMLNLFAGIGQMNYAKSSRLYLQSMLELPHTHSWMHKNCPFTVSMLSEDLNASGQNYGQIWLLNR